MIKPSRYKLIMLVAGVVLLLVPSFDALALCANPTGFYEVSPGSGVFLPCIFLSGSGPASQYTAIDLILAIIEAALFIVGLLTVLFIIIGGYRYVTAYGNEELVEAAKKTLKNAIIGLIIVILAFVMVRVIVDVLTQAPSGGSSGGGGGGGGGGPALNIEVSTSSSLAWSEGEVVLIIFTATPSLPSGESYAWTMDSSSPPLPGGLTFNPAGGSITGVTSPGDAGTYNVIITATNSTGGSGWNGFDIVISP